MNAAPGFHSDAYSQRQEGCSVVECGQMTSGYGAIGRNRSAIATRRRASSRVKRIEHAWQEEASSGSHMRHGKPTGRVVCHTSSRIWRRDLDGQAHDHAHHVRRAFTLQAALSRLRRLTVAMSSSPTSLYALHLSVPAHKPQNAYALVIKSLISRNPSGLR